MLEKHGKEFIFGFYGAAGSRKKYYSLIIFVKGNLGMSQFLMKAC